MNESSAILKNIKLKQYNRHTQISFRLASGSDSYLALINSEFLHLVNSKDSNGMLTLSNCQLLISNSSFISTSLYLSSGGVGQFYNLKEIRVQKTLHLINSVISKNNLTQGGVYHISNSQGIENQLEMKKNNFYYNGGQIDGGVFYLESQKTLLIEQNNFFANQAENGAILFLNEDTLPFNITFLNSKFMKNRAVIASMIQQNTNSMQNIKIKNKQSIQLLYSSIKSNSIGRIYLFQNEYIQNHETYPSTFEEINIKTYKILFENHKTKKTIKIQSGKNYGNFDCLAQISLESERNQFVSYTTFDFYKDISISSNNSTRIQLSNYINNTLSSPNYSDSFDFTVTSNGILCVSLIKSKQNNPENSDPKNYQFFYFDSTCTLEFEYIKCSLGDIFELNQNHFICKTCPQDTYSLHSDESCSTCLFSEMLNCSYGGHYLFPKEGYWRYNENSSSFIACPKETACIGAESAEFATVQFYSGECAYGYQGPLCNQCIDSFGKVDANTCAKCDSASFFIWTLIKIVFGLGSSIYSMFLGIQFVYLILCLALFFQCIKICQPETEELNNELISTYILKLFIYYIQGIQVILQYPIELSFGFQIIEGVSLLRGQPSSAISIDCVIKNTFWRDRPIICFNILVAIIYPLLIFCLTILIKYVIQKKKQIQINSQKSDLIIPERINLFNIKFIKITIQLIIIILMYSIDYILQENFKLFTCINIGDSDNTQSRLLDELNVDCNSSTVKTWKYYVSLPMILAVGCIFPLTLFFILKSIQKSKKIKTDDIDNKFQFGFIYFAFENKYIYWELVIILRKILLQLIIVLFSNQIKFNEKYPSIIQCFIVTIATLLQIYCQPYNKLKYNKLNKFESICLLSQLICNFQFVFSLYTQDVIPTIITVINLWVFLLINIFIFLLFAKLYIVFAIKPAIIKGLDQFHYYLNKFLRRKKPTITNLESDAFELIRTTPQTQLTLNRTKFNGQFKNCYALESSSNIENERALKDEIEKLKSIIKLKNQEIEYLQSKLKNNSENQNYLNQKKLSKEELDIDFSECKSIKSIDLNLKEIEKIQSSQKLQKDKILFETSNYIINQTNFLQGEQCYSQQNCACQLISIESINIKLLIESIQFDFPQNEIINQEVKKRIIDTASAQFPRIFQF